MKRYVPLFKKKRTRIKRRIRAGFLLCSLLCISALPVLAGEVQKDDETTTLTVGTATPFTGRFFTNLWGGTVSDTDVRMLIHGYNLVEWRSDEGAFRIDPSVVSGVAVTDNAAGDRTYTLTIYTDLLYNDGTAITASDYAFSLLLGIAPQTAGIGGAVRRGAYILGYEDYLSGKSGTLRGVRILNEQTLSITIDHSFLPYFYELALLDCMPAPIDVLAPGCKMVDDGQGICIVNEDAAAKEPLFTAQLLRETILDAEIGYLSHPGKTCGPYRLTSYDQAEAIFRRNEYYKGNSDGERPRIEQIRFRVVSGDAMMDELSSGQLDLLNKCVNAAAVQQGLALVSQQDRFSMSNYARTGMAFFAFCCERGGVSSAAVRQAIAMCLDKEQLVKETVGSYGLAISGYYGIGQWMVQMLNGALAYPVSPPPDEADAEAVKEYEENLEEWEALNFDSLQVYDLDVDAAVSMLEQDGWVLNRDGEPFEPGRDDVRCKRADSFSEEEAGANELTALELTLLYPEGSLSEESLQECFADHLAKAGILLHLECADPQELFWKYYRQDGERDCDMIWLSDNFDAAFDPAAAFSPEESSVRNATGIADPKLYQRAADLRTTQPGDALDYCRKWVAFQERFAQVLPMLPVYSNVYFDFYDRSLQNYQPASGVSWGQAIVGAYIGDPGDPGDPEDDLSGMDADFEEVRE